ncbi:MAG: hypothetical protein AAF694_05655 [Bacteroidota bacterium]
MLHTKKCFFLLCMMAWGFLTDVSGQSKVDITQLVADTKTFAFNDSKNTVKGFIYEELDVKTNCCGSDRIYLEVRIHPSGYVVEAKTLTGKNECFKSSAIDIVKNIKWEAKDFKGTKPVYFEIRPDINCDGGKDNSYKPVAIFNNELLDESGKPKNPEDGSLIYLGDPDADSAEESATENTASNEASEPVESAAEEIVAETSETVTEKESPQPTENTDEPMKPAAEKVDEVAENVTTANKDVKSAIQEVENQGKETVEAVKEAIPAAKEPTPTQVTTPPTKEASPSPDPLLVSSDTPGRRTMAEEVAEEATTVVDSPATPAEEVTLSPEDQAEKDAEIMVLKEQLNELREKEEALQNRQQKRQEILERRRQAQMERRRELQAQREAEEESNDPFAGQETEEGEFGEDYASAQDPDQDDLDRLSQELSDIQNRKRELEDSRKRDAEELDQFIRDRVRLEEEIRRKEEEITRKREQQELDRLVEDRTRQEDQKRDLEGEMQRLMDEIQRLQDEMQRKVADLQRQEEDIQRINSTIAQREADINQQRMLREQQLEQELALMRQQADLESASLFRNAPDAGMSSPNLSVNPGLLNDTSAQARQIVNQIMLLQQQLQMIQQQPQNNSGGISGTVTPRITTGISGSTNLPEGSKNAADDRSWENVNYNAPDGSAPTTGTLGRGSSTGSSGFDPVEGYSPDSSHSGTFENTAGPRFRSMQYGTGANAMNRYLADQLKARGLCGTVAAFAELTVNGNGQVVGTRIIKANSTNAMINLPAIFNSMSFLPSYSQVPERTNLSFEMNIPCGPGQNPAVGSFTPTPTN